MNWEKDCILSTKSYSKVINEWSFLINNYNNNIFKFNLLLKMNTQGTQGEFSTVPLKSASNNYSGKPVFNHKIVLLGDMGVGKTCISIR